MPVIATFDDPVSACTVTATLRASAHCLVVDLDVVGAIVANTRACHDRLPRIVADDQLVDGVLALCPEAVDARFDWAETSARVELVTLTDAVVDVVDGDDWQARVRVTWATGSALLLAGVPDGLLDTARVCGSDVGMCAVWPIGADDGDWLTGSVTVDSARVLEHARWPVLRARRAWLVLRRQGVLAIAGTFDADTLRRLARLATWSGTMPDDGREEHEAALRAMRDDGLRALARDADAVAVVIEAGKVTGTVHAVSP